MQLEFPLGSQIKPVSSSGAVCEVGDNVVSEPLTGCCDQCLDQRQRLEIEVAKYVQEFPPIWRAKTKRENTYADVSAIE